MTEKTLNDLFLTTLKDVYYAEKAILRALPKMAKAAGSGDLKEAFLKHRDETAGHVERLEQIFDNLGKTEGVCAFPKKLQISSPILLAPYGRRGAEGPLLRGDFRFGIGQMN